MKKRSSGWMPNLASIALITISATGCAAQQTQTASDAARTVNPVMQVNSTTYDATSGVATVNVSANRADATAVRGEQALDVTDRDGIINFATARYPNQNLRWVRVVTVHGPDTIHKAPFLVRVPPASSLTPNQMGPGMSGDTLEGSAAGFAGGSMLPPGVQLDPSIRPLAPVTTSNAAKAAAVLRIAESKLGTPYIWGHNEDRGQYGFDCSNFTEYVYHHALGYQISPYSVVQNSSVGYRTSRANMQPGDLLIFENGKHVGICVSKDTMIDAGGGKGQVSYMTLAPGSYWGDHMTSVRRMY